MGVFGKKTYAHGLEKVLGVGINVELAGLGLGNIQSGDLRNVLILALTLLLLKLEGDTADGATLNTLHQVGGVTSNLIIINQHLNPPRNPLSLSTGWKICSYLVAETLGGNDGDLIAKALVGLEVERQLGVVTLDDDLGGPLDCLLSGKKHMSELIFPLLLNIACGFCNGSPWF